LPGVHKNYTFAKRAASAPNLNRRIVQCAPLAFDNQRDETFMRPQTFMRTGNQRGRKTAAKVGKTAGQASSAAVMNRALIRFSAFFVSAACAPAASVNLRLFSQNLLVISLAIAFG